MKRSSEFPLFCQTAIAIFGFLLLIAMFSSVTTAKPALNSAIAPTVTMAHN